jgi:hypothetical protein
MGIQLSGTPDLQQCMRNGAPKLLSVLLQAGILVLSVWTGSEVGRRQRSTWLGLAAGTAVFLALTGLLAWLGLGPTT